MKIKSVFPLVCAFGFAGWCLWGCKPIKPYPEIPEIHYQKLIFEDRTDDLEEIFKKAILTFSFVDGDGDLGVRPEEKNPNGSYRPGGGYSRIYYTWYRKISGETYDPYTFPSDSITLWSEIPYHSVMDKSEAQNKVLKGEIEIELDTPRELQGLDMMRIGFYIVDRARNKSNIEYTPDFSILNPPEDL